MFVMSAYVCYIIMEDQGKNTYKNLSPETNTTF